jgi:UDP-N-acetylglucosamine 1-carboxyvinyltransferase
MDKLLIHGGVPLAGEVRISGAKNAALPIMCAALLSAAPLRLANVPHLRDVTTLLKLLGGMGVAVSLDEKLGLELDAGRLHFPLHPTNWSRPCAPPSWCWDRSRALRRGARIPPGGCAIGQRPVDLHIKGCRPWVRIFASSTVTSLRARRAEGARIFSDLVTVTGTENLMMAACLAEGTTVIENAAREPEVVDLANCLKAMGASIEGAGSHTITIEGVSALADAGHRIMPDRIETGTFLVAAAASGGSVRLVNTSARLLETVVEKLREAGAQITADDDIDCWDDGRIARGEPAHRALSRIPDRHAGAIHGARLHRARHGGIDRNHFREPLHARARVAAPRRRHRNFRQRCRGQGRGAA